MELNGIPVASGNLFSIIKNTSATVIIRGLFGVVRIVILLLIARKFGPIEFGYISLAVPFIEIFKVAADLGIDTVSIKRIAVDERGAENFLNNILAIKVLLSTISILVAPILFYLIYRNVRSIEILFVVASSIFTGLLINAFNSYFQAKLSMMKIVMSNVIGVTIYGLLTLAGMVLDVPLIILVAAIPISEFVTLYMITRLYSTQHPVHLEFDFPLIRSTLKESIYVGISGIIVVIYLRLDGLMIGSYLGEGAVGEYAVASRIVEPFLLIFSSLSIALYASLSGLWSGDNTKEARKTIIRVMVPAAGIAIVGALVLSLFVPSLVAKIWKGYENSGAVLQVLGWSLIFKAVNMQLTAIMNSLGKFRIITIIASINLVMCVVFNIIFLQKFGIRGGAMTVVLVEGVNMISQFICVSYLMNNFIGKRLREWQNKFKHQ